MRDRERRWELGSEFDWCSSYVAPSSTATFLPERFEMFATGRGALIALTQKLSKARHRLRLHLPSYFCTEVAEALSRFCELRWYRDLPTDPAPDPNRIELEPGDCVLAVNLFGLRQDGRWQHWESRGGAVLIEDHTHDPASAWAQASTADYAMASLRKVLPLPDGAILWSPKKLEVPKAAPHAARGADLKLAAMIMKHEYLAGAALPKERFRTLQVEGERLLAERDGAPASEFTQAILPFLDVAEFRRRRAANAKLFFDMLQRRPVPGVALLASSTQADIPYNPVLICRDASLREALLRHLISENIYAAVHWRQDRNRFSSGDNGAIALSARLLTVPLDFRYGPDDAVCVVNSLHRFAADDGEM